MLCKLGAIRQANLALTDGVYRELLLTNRQYAFARILGNEAVITAVNNDANPVHMEINCPVSASGAQEALTGTAQSSGTAGLSGKCPRMAVQYL